MTHEELIQTKQKAAISVKKVNGLTKKVQQMVEDDVYCPEIIQQIDASIGLLESAKKTLLKGHLHHCLEDKLVENKVNAIDELVKIFDLK